MEIGKLTQDALDKLLADKANAEKLAKEQALKIKNAEDTSEKLKELDSLRAAKEASESELLKIKVNARVDQVKTWLGAKDNKETIVSQLSKMSDGEFDLFKEGKLNEDYKTKEQLEQEKQDLASQKSDFEANKDKIIKDAANKVVEKEPKIVPNSEIAGSGDQQPKAKGPANGAFPTMDSLKDMFNLRENPLYEEIEGYEKRTADYLNSSYNEDKKGYGY